MPALRAQYQPGPPQPGIGTHPESEEFDDLDTLALELAECDALDEELDSDALEDSDPDALEELEDAESLELCDALDDSDPELLDHRLAELEEPDPLKLCDTLADSDPEVDPSDDALPESMLPLPLNGPLPSDNMLPEKPLPPSELAPDRPDPASELPLNAPVLATEPPYELIDGQLQLDPSADVSTSTLRAA